ncbi:MAG TPA: tetratricopeptide repeat protein, partial [Bryobacteraceae bacterium]|nr:tetratricopeptide repeat protein [Bryobacteraceae bacterium]
EPRASARLALLGFAVLCCAVSAWAQFAALPQAETPEEFDAYLRVLDGKTPAAVTAAGDAFLKGWPASGLRAHVYELELEAYRAMGDADKAIAAGEASLRLAPDNLVVLVNLAGVLANGTREEKRLARAEECARRAIAVAATLRVPRFIPPAEWEESSARWNSQAHAALGLVANARGDTATAIAEFEKAIAQAPHPDGTQYYRLGLLYRAVGKSAEAKRAFERAAEAGEAEIRARAERELRR